MRWKTLKIFVLFTFLASVVAVPQVAAEPESSQAKPVLELFTSQGCSSCPPADVLLERYIRDKSVIALSYSVDYWDYLGWKDTLASPAFTARQRAYALTRGDRQVYTPQVVVNGLAHAVGSRKKAINSAIAKTAGDLAGKVVPMKLWTKGETVVVKVGAATQAKTKSGTIWIALTKKEALVTVKRGENANRKLAYHNVVRELIPVGMWDGTETTLKLPHSALKSRGSDGCVVLLQKGKTGPILGAAEMASW